MIGNVYTIRNSASHSTAITVLQARAASTKPLILLRAWLTQVTAVTAVMVHIQLLRQTTAGTMTTITAATAAEHSPSQPTATMTGGHTATAEPTAGDILVEESFNAPNGWLYLPVPEERIVIPVSGFLGLKFALAPVVKVWQYGMTVMEIG